jgi:excisionase family DNA binding protein
MQTIIENPFSEIFRKLTAIENQIRFLHQNQNRPEPDFLTVDQAAAFLNFSKGTIYKKCSLGELPHYKSGKKLHFKKSELTRLLETGKIDVN